MLLSFLNRLNNKVFPKYVEKVKPLILESAYVERIKYGRTKHFIIALEDSSKLRPYMQLNPSVIDTALNQLENDKKIVITKDEIKSYFILTDKTFNYLSKNRHPVKEWFKNNIFNILNLVIALWGAITGTIALFFK